MLAEAAVGRIQLAQPLRARAQGLLDASKRVVPVGQRAQQTAEILAKAVCPENEPTEAPMSIAPKDQPGALADEANHWGDDVMVVGHLPFMARAASLLPALLLARIDGKSPVEYVTEEATRERVRGVAIPLVKTAPATLGAVRDAWKGEFAV